MCLEVVLPRAGGGGGGETSRRRDGLGAWGSGQGVTHSHGQVTGGRGRAPAGLQGAVGSVDPAGPQHTGFRAGAASLVTPPLGQETFLLFVTGIKHFHNVGFHRENSPAWASTFNLLTLASLMVHGDVCKI